MISNECEASCPSEARADIARVEIVVSLCVTYTIFHNLSIVNSALWCLYRGAKNSDSQP